MFRVEGDSPFKPKTRDQAWGKNNSTDHTGDIAGQTNTSSWVLQVLCSAERGSDFLRESGWPPQTPEVAQTQPTPCAMPVIMLAFPQEKSQGSHSLGEGGPSPTLSRASILHFSAPGSLSWPRPEPPQPHLHRDHTSAQTPPETSSCST